MTKVVRMPGKEPEMLLSMQLRLPASLHRTLVRKAEENFRSLNGEICWRLATSLIFEEGGKG